MTDRIGADTLLVPSYDTKTLAATALRYRNAAAEADPEDRVRYLAFAEKCEQLLRRSYHTPVTDDAETGRLWLVSANSAVGTNVHSAPLGKPASLHRAARSLVA